jgi:uncharacterized protein YbaP (TraB family)
MEGRAQTLPGSSKTCLWEIPAEGGAVFLLGSIHFMRADDYPLPPAMEAAYAACRVVVFETDIGLMQDPRVQARMLELGMLRRPVLRYDRTEPAAGSSQVCGNQLARESSPVSGHG